MFEILRMVFVLAVICAGSGLALSGVYEFTKETHPPHQAEGGKTPCGKGGVHRQGR